MAVWWPLLALSACGTFDTPAPDATGVGDVTIVHTARFEGEIEPCG